MAENAKQDSTLSRRDFLRTFSKTLSAASIAMTIGVSDLSSDPQHIHDETAKRYALTDFNINREITQTEIASYKQIFEDIAIGIQELQQESGFLQEEVELINGFNKEIFLENSSKYIDRIVRLQELCKKFNNDLDLDREIKFEAINIIKYNFKKLIIPLYIFNKVKSDNLDTSSKDIAKMFLFDTKERKEEIPIDPLIGMEVYTEIGMQTWFTNFDTKYVDNVAVGTYPITKKFLTESGIEFKKLTEQSGVSFSEGNIPLERPEPFEFNIGKESINHGGVEYKTVEVDKDVQEKIYAELEFCGIDRAISSLIFLNNKDNPNFYGFLNQGFDRKINITIGTNKLDKEYFDKYGKVLLHIIKHEIFHILMIEIDKMNDYDSYLTYAKLNIMHRKTCPVFEKHEIQNEEELSLSPLDDNYSFTTKIISHFNEAFRNRYSNMLIVDESSHLQQMILDFYRSELFTDKEFWKSSMLKVNFEEEADYERLSNEDRIKLGKKSISWLVDHVRSVYNNQKDSMSHLEKFVSEELNERSQNGSLFSEIAFYQNGLTPNEFAKVYIPGVLMYSSILRDDWRFVNAVLKDIDEKFKRGIISDNKKIYFLRKFGYMINTIRENNGVGGVVSQIVGEHLADQFAYSLNRNLQFDFGNARSSYKVHAVIHNIIPEFKKLLFFYRQKHLV